MKIKDLYSPFYSAFEGLKGNNFESLFSKESNLKSVLAMAKSWDVDLNNVNRWMKSPEYSSSKQTAQDFIGKIQDRMKSIEDYFGGPLIGELCLIPSLMSFDGFARFDMGSHTVWFGVDHPDADEKYLSALLAHELSHVYRDHQPEVWKNLKKPISHLTREEYLDHGTAEEHLVSEGLATLTSQVIFPNIPLHTHHYYFPEELQWCLENDSKIDAALRSCLKEDQNVWKFYEEGLLDNKSPSRIQYYWAAKTINNWLNGGSHRKNYDEIIRESHGWNSQDFECFKT